MTFRLADQCGLLIGDVVHPEVKRNAGAVPGVRTGENDVKVLPQSTKHDAMRKKVPLALFTWYAVQAVAPVHITVNQGHVTLEGLVTIAESVASGAVFRHRGSFIRWHGPG